MNKIVKAMGLFVLAAMVVASAVSCEGWISFTGFSVTGKVVNVRAPSTQKEFWKGETGTATLEGAQITLKNKKADGKSPEAGTVNSDGTYSIPDVAPGKYTLSGTKNGWSFVDREVDITGYFATLPDVLAFETPSDTQQILVMVEWQNTAMDVDSYVTRDIDPTNGYDGMIIAGFEGDLTGGNNSTTYTGTYGTYFGDPEGKVELERDIIQVKTTDPEDVKLPRVETVKINGPVADGPETLRYYIRLYNQTAGSLTGYPGASADATVFVMQGTDNVGTYQIAVNSSEMILGVLQMQWDTVQNMWDIGSYSNPGFDSGDWTNLAGVRSIAGGVVEVSEIK